MLRGAKGEGVGPLPLQGLDESLSLAVGLWPVGTSLGVLQSELLAHLSKAPCNVAGAIVGQDALDRYSSISKPGSDPFQEALSADGTLVFEDLHVGDSGGVIDGDVGVLPADASVAVLALAGDPVADSPDSAEFLDVQVHELAGVLLLVAPNGLRRGELR